MANPGRDAQTPRAKLKDTSGLLMSVIRTLSSSADTEQREKEKSKLEKEYRDSDAKLKKMVSTHYSELTSIIQAFSKIQNRVTDSRERIRRTVENLNSCKGLLHCKRDELKRLWIEGLEQRHILGLLDKIDDIRNVPDKLDEFLSKKHYLHAAEMIANSVNLLSGELLEIEGLGELEVQVMTKQEVLYQKLVDELHRQIYVRSTSEVVKVFQRQGSVRVTRGKKDAPPPPTPQKLLLEASLRGHKRTGSRDLIKVDQPSSYGDFSSDGVSTNVTEDLNNTDPEENRPKFIAILIESLATLKRVSDAIEVIKASMQPELLAIVRRASQQVADNAYQSGETQLESLDQPKYLLELLELVFQQFRCVADTHQTVLSNLKRLAVGSSRSEDIKPYEMAEFWSKVQAVIQILLRDYLDIQKSVVNPQQSGLTFDDPGSTDIAQYFSKKRATRPKKASLFKFDASSHAISMHSYLREQRQETYGQHGEVIEEKDAKVEGQKMTYVCKTSIHNIRVIFNPLQAFVKEIELATSCKPRSCALHSFIETFVKTFFLREVHYNLSASTAEATKGFDALKNVTDNKTQRELGAPKPLLQSTAAVNKNLWELRELMCQLPDYSQQFLNMACKILQDYRETCQHAYRSIVQSEFEVEDSRIISASWARDEDISRLLRSLPNWLALQQDPLQTPTTEDGAPDSMSEQDMRVMNSKESDILINNLSQADKLIPPNEIISDISQLRTLGNLHESVEWFSKRIKAFTKSLGHPTIAVTCGPADTSYEDKPPLSVTALDPIVALAADFRELADFCLLVLHLEVRVHCFFFLMPVAKQSNYYCAIDDMEPDSNVIRLNRDLSIIEEALNQSLQLSKFKYMFEGLGHLVASILVASTHHLKRINDNGVKKMCRNIFAVQQQLTNITMSREADLDHARQYYELLYSNPGEILAQVMEQGAQFSELEYLDAMSLLNRSTPGANVKLFEKQKEKLRSVIREQHIHHV